MSYKKLNDRSGTERSDMILRISDNAYIPKNEANTDYQAYLEWAKTNKAEEPD